MKSDDTSLILFVCAGNTCRSPMAKVILEKILLKADKAGRYVVDSAGCFDGSGDGASLNARKAIQELCGKDLLRSHVAKGLTPDLIAKADLILVMEERMKQGLPTEKTYSLAEYAGESGDIPDPFLGTLADYAGCAEELTRLLVSVAGRLK